MSNTVWSSLKKYKHQQKWTQGAFLKNTHAMHRHAHTNKYKHMYIGIIMKQKCYQLKSWNGHLKSLREGSLGSLKMLEKGNGGEVI